MAELAIVSDIVSGVASLIYLKGLSFLLSKSASNSLFQLGSCVSIDKSAPRKSETWLFLKSSFTLSIGVVVFTLSETLFSSITTCVL